MKCSEFLAYDSNCCASGCILFSGDPIALAKGLGGGFLSGVLVSQFRASSRFFLGSVVWLILVFVLLLIFQVVRGVTFTQA